MYKHFVSALLVLGFVVYATNVATAQSVPNYHVTDSISVGGSGGWDYLAFDGANRTLYVAHSDEIDAIDVEAKTVFAKIPAHGSHGIAVANEFNRGFFTNGKTNTVGIFDLKTHTLLSEIPVGNKPDAIVYDSSSKRVLAMCGDDNSATVIDAATSKVLGVIEFGGEPEFGVADGSGHVFVNLEDESETLMLDPKTMKVVKRWKLGTGEGPSGLAMDVKNKLLFAGCHNQKMVVLDASSGKVVATLPIGKGVDANGFDPVMGYAFSSNGDATLTVAQLGTNKKWAVVQNVQTEMGARTMAIDPLTHNIFMPTASFGPPPSATEDHPHPRPSVIEGSFRILIVSPK